MRLKAYFIIFCWLVSLNLFGQRITAEQYINTYKDWAISEMKRSGVPASIKLAQGMLESGNGNSRLAVEANNHFGIKCHGWSGGKVYHNDDKQNECFRKYKDAKESFTDHTDFLTSRSRYAFLFEYKSTDYKSWAKGLSKAGYATDPNYPQKLITVIERYELHQYDKGVKANAQRKQNTSARTGSRTQQSRETNDDFATFNINRHQVMVNNRTEFITASRGDTYKSLSAELDMMPWQLPKYNDAKATDEIREGQNVYLQPKRRKAERGKNTHKINAGETMYDVSQKYAVKLQRLYALNRMEEGTQPDVGEVLYLRKKKK